MSPDYWRALASRFGLDASPYKLPEIWEAQTAALAIRNTGMAVTNDIGNPADIHPTNKQEVGRRLSLWALAKTYGRPDLVYSGPSFRSMELQDGAIVLTFDHADGLMTRDGEPPDWFELAGNDQRFVEASAVIDGDTVVVSSEGRDQPDGRSVRLAYGRRTESGEWSGAAGRSVQNPSLVVVDGPGGGWR